MFLQACGISRTRVAGDCGGEWAFYQHWSAKLEYLYIAVVGSGANTDHLNTFRAGINYRF